MSTIKRSLVLEEIKQSDNDFVDLLPLRYLSISSAAEIETRSACQVVKVSGNITVSF